jgi:hypothetical protein
MAFLITNGSYRKHVYIDLQPYFCTFRQCTDPDRLYGSRRAWFDHELTFHRRQWPCIRGCSNVFLSRDEFLAHLRHDHPEAGTTTQWSQLASSCEQPIPSNAEGTCPFCQDKLFSRKMIRQHVGRHMARIALWSLPATMEDEVDKDGNEDSDPLSAQSSADEADYDQDSDYLQGLSNSQATDTAALYDYHGQSSTAGADHATENIPLPEPGINSQMRNC